MAEQLVPLLGIVDKDTEALTGLTYAGGGADRYPAPVSGDSVEVVVKLKTSNSGAANMAEIAAAHADLAGVGGTIRLPRGNYAIAGNLQISSGNSSAALGLDGVTIRGTHMGATRLLCESTGGATFSKASGHAHSFRDLTLIGPGTSNANAVATDWLNAAGGALWENVWIEGFGCGSQFWDATSMTFVNVHWHGNGVNQRLGYNCDLFQYYGGRIQNAVTRGIHIGWRGPTNQTGGMKCSPVNLHGARFGDCGETAVYIDDVEGSGVGLDGCYFEYNTCDVIIGGNGTNAGPKNIVLSRCDFTRPKSTSDVRIKCLEPNTNATLVLQDSRSDFSYTGNFIEAGFQSSVTWARNDIGFSGAGASVKIGDSSISSGWTKVVPKHATWEYNRSHLMIGDGTLLGNANPMLSLGMTNGTGKDLVKYTRYSGSTASEVGLMPSAIRDVDGKFVLFEGPIRPGAIALASLPTAGVLYRGITVRVEGAAGVADGLYTCMKSAADTYSWKQVAAG